MNSLNTFHSSVNLNNNKIGPKYYLVVSAGL